MMLPARADWFLRRLLSLRAWVEIDPSRRDYLDWISTGNGHFHVLLELAREELRVPRVLSDGRAVGPETIARIERIDASLRAVYGERP